MKCYWKDDGGWIKGKIVNEGPFIEFSAFIEKKFKRAFRVQSTTTEFRTDDRILIVGYERMNVHQSFVMRIILVSPGWRHPDGSK